MRYCSYFENNYNEVEVVGHANTYQAKTTRIDHYRSDFCFRHSVIRTCFVNDTLGGLWDWRMSHAMGLNGTNRIPLGKTPEDAIQQFCHFPSMQVIHREPVEGGLLLFIKRFYQQDGNDLQVEYVRKTWLGWKWAWGGGYGIGGSKSPMSAKSALNYMSMPKVENISTPFPMVFGDVLDSTIKKEGQRHR